MKHLGKIHFWGTMISAYAIFWPMHYIGMAGVPGDIILLIHLMHLSILPK
jgi:heme/copper-type cytochrome/quinol oxidase subunit 1